MKEDTQVIEPVASDDIASDLAKAMEGLDDEDIHKEPAEKPDPGMDKEIQKAGDEHDDKKPDQEGEPDAPAGKEGDDHKPASDEDAGDKKPVEQPDDLKAPDHWPAADKELFSKQSKEGKEFLLRRHKDMEADYTRKSQEIAGFRRDKEQFDEILGPYRPRYQLQGWSDVDAVRHLVSAHQYLDQDPVNAIQWLIGGSSIDQAGAAQLLHAISQHYNLDLNQVAQVAPRVDPAVQQLTQKIAQLEKQNTDQLTAKQHAEYQANLNKVTQFAEAKDAQGNPLHPYFDDVAEEVIGFIKGGLVKDLDSAYERAIYANPGVRAKVLAAENEAKQKKEAEERRKKADDAKRAGFDVSGQGGLGTAEAKHDSIEASLSAAWDKAS